MKQIKFTVGILLMLLGVVAGFYLGVWVMFIGGIVQIVEAFKAEPVNSLNVAIGIVRFLGAGFVGWFSFLVVFGTGCGFVVSSDKD